MVPLAAPPVAELPGVVGERVDDPRVGEERERPVHGREPEAFAAGAQPGVELLRGHVVAFANELRGHGEPPRRGPQAVPAKRFLDVVDRDGHRRGSVVTLMRTILMTTLSTDWVDYAVHFGVDVCGSLGTLYAQRFCRHLWHQFLIWLGLAVLVTVTTVNLVG